MSASVFGWRLRCALAAANLQQRDLADRLGVASSTVGNWCQGTREPELAVIQRIADVVQVSPAYLAFGEANSDLIAAAPELKAIAEAIETRIGFSPDPMLGPGSPVARALLAALRKARGAA